MYYKIQAISNIRTVRSFAAEPTEMKLYQSSLNKTSDANTKLGFHIGIFQGIFSRIIYNY